MLGAMAETLKALESQLEIDASEILSKYSAHAKSKFGIWIEFIAARGGHSQFITETARENNIDPVVVASSGLGGTRWFTLGRVSHEIARKAKLPVIVISSL